MAKGIRKRQILRVIKKIEEVRKVSTMERADFPDELKEQTRLWRYSWIVYPLEEILAILQAEVDR